MGEHRSNTHKRILYLNNQFNLGIIDSIIGGGWEGIGKFIKAPLPLTDFYIKIVIFIDEYARCLCKTSMSFVLIFVKVDNLKPP